MKRPAATHEPVAIARESVNSKLAIGSRMQEESDPARQGDLLQRPVCPPHARAEGRLCWSCDAGGFGSSCTAAHRDSIFVFLGEEGGGEDLLSAPNIGNGSNVNELPGAPRNEIARTHVFVPLVCVYCIRRIEPHRVFSDSGDEEISQLLQGLR